ncbi:autotransporter domain-containing protein [bacterium]|nr:autotransporter domain-containing protein [bacterium]
MFFKFGTILFVLSGLAPADTFYVTNTDDSGAGSLRQAITDGNASGVDATIEFQTEGTITLASALPALVVKTTFDLADYNVTIEANSGSSTADSFKVDNGAAGTGVFTVGAGSTWTNSNDLYVGHSGVGDFAVSGGGLVDSDYGVIGYNVGSEGAAVVTGAGSVWTASVEFYVGYTGTGTLTISDAGMVLNPSGTIGNEAGSDGTVTVTGAGSTWISNTGLSVGYSGTGALNISDGGSVSSTGFGYIGSEVGSEGTVTMAGAGSTWTNTGNLYVGRFGTGTLTVSGSTVDNSAELYVGSTGNGNMTVSDGGEVNNTTGVIGYNLASEGTVAITDAGSSWVNSDELYIGYTGTGTMTVSDGGGVENTNGVIGYEAGAEGTATVTGVGSTWANSNHLLVGYTGTGTLTISAGGSVSNAGRGYIGFEADSEGTLNVTGAGSTWASTQNIYVGRVGTGTLTVSGGTVDGTAELYVGYTDPGVGTMTISNSGDVSDTNGVIGYEADSEGTVTVTGAGSIWNNSANLYVGYTGTGTLNVSDNGSVSVNNGAGTLTLAEDAGSVGTLNIGEGLSAGVVNADDIFGNDGTATINFNHNENSYIFAPDIAGTLDVNHNGDGTTILAGATTYTGDTTVNAGTLDVYTDRTLTGNLNVAGGVLYLRSGALTITNDYTQAADTTLKLDVTGSAVAGSVVSAGTTTISANSSLHVNVTGYTANGSAYTIIDGPAAGGLVNVPGTITDSSAVLTFAGTTDNDDLTLTATRANTYTSLGVTENEKAAGTALEAAGGDGTGDMMTVLGQLDQLTSQTDVQNALSQVTPSVDAGVMDIGYTTITLFQEKVTDHLADTRSGLAAGDAFKDVDIWAKGFGNYLDQDKRDHIDGYKAHTLGTTIGVDFLVADPVRIGISGGYAFSRVDSKQSNIGDTDIDSYQGTIYGGYDGGPFYIDVAGSFAYNKYEGSRNINFGGIARTADSDYDGQQYSAYIGGGYTFETNGLEITPMASLRYIYLYLDDYTESGADALNLKVDSQDYDFLQSGLGARFAYPIRNADMTFIPEIHGMWLYDFVGDEQQATSTFTGGGASFKTDGADPAQNSFNVGGSLTFIMTNNWSLLLSYDFEGKEDFIGHSGSVTMKYGF